MPFSLWNYSYYIVIALQIICILHALKRGNRDWLYLLIFLPLVGAIIYIIREVIPGMCTTPIPDNVQRSFLPNSRIRQLEHQLKIADTDTNRLHLAAEYARQGQYSKAIELTNACLVGIYATHPGMMLDLARYSFYNEQYTESLDWFNKVIALKGKGLDKPEDELLYARALQHHGEKDKAEEEFKRLIRVHHSMEARYYYGMFLKEKGLTAEAKEQFRAVLEEKDLHPKHVRRLNAKWIMASRKALLIK